MTQNKENNDRLGKNFNSYIRFFHKNQAYKNCKGQGKKNLKSSKILLKIDFAQMQSYVNNHTPTFNFIVDRKF